LTEPLERIRPWEFLKSVTKRKPANWLLITPEFPPWGGPILCTAAGLAGSQTNPVPYIIAYGREKDLLPKHASETVRAACDSGVIERVEATGLSKKAYESLVRELRQAGVSKSVSIDMSGPEIRDHSMKDYYKWVAWLVNAKWSKGADDLVLTYEEPLAGYLGAALQSPVLGLDLREERLPATYRKLIDTQTFNRVLFVVHRRDLEQWWRPHRIWRELQKLENKVGETILVRGDSIELSTQICRIVREDWKHTSKRPEILFQGHIHDIDIGVPLAIQIGALYIQCGYDLYDDRIAKLIEHSHIRKVVLAGPPEAVDDEDLEAWYYIHSGIRHQYERILGRQNVYRMWLNASKRNVLKQMVKYKTEASAHILFWAFERLVLETMYETPLEF